MHEAFVQFELWSTLALEWCILILELMGVIVIAIAGIQSFYEYARRNDDVRLHFAQAMAMGLEFKLAGEILRTVQVREISEIAVVGAIIVLRAILNYLIQQEIKHERAYRLYNKGPGHPGARKTESKQDNADLVEIRQESGDPVDDEGYREDDE